MPVSVYNRLNRFGLIPQNLKDARSSASGLSRLPRDAQELFTASQKIAFMRARYTVCLAFQKALEEFWNKHFSDTVWRITKSRLDRDDNTLDETYSKLCRADFNVSHEGNRDLWNLKRFLDRIDAKQLPTAQDVNWAMMCASSMPETFMSAYQVYTGGTSIDVRKFFPDVNFEPDQPKSEGGR